MSTGWMMCGNTKVASYDGKIVTTILPERCPFCFRFGRDLDFWLESRAIDRRRPNSRALKKILRLSDTSNIAAAMRVHGAAITDNYWIQNSEEHLTWDAVQFKDDCFADVALYGSSDSIMRKYTTRQRTGSTPELTNIGRFEKCWRKIDHQWIMQKRGSAEERFSEVFVSKLGTELGFDMALYTDHPDGFVETPDFTAGHINFEPMAYLVGENEDYEKNYDILYEFSPVIAHKYLNLLFMDALIFNVDRHTMNYGLMRDQNTGQVISLAPNFDNNMALISRGYPSDPNHMANPLAEYFLDFLSKKQIKYAMPIISEAMVRHIAEETMPYEHIQRDVVVNMVMAQYAFLTKRA